MRFTWNRRGLEAIDQQVAKGLTAAGKAVVPLAKANLAPHRRTGQTADSIRVVDRYVNDEKSPAVIITTASGDGFFIHEGTSDTAPIPFFTDALDSVVKKAPDFIKKAGSGNDALSRAFGITRR